MDCVCGERLNVKHVEEIVTVDGKQVKKVKWYCECSKCSFKSRKSLTKKGALTNADKQIGRMGRSEQETKTIRNAEDEEEA